MQGKMLSAFGQIQNFILGNTLYKHSVQQKYSMQPEFQIMPHTKIFHWANTGTSITSCLNMAVEL
jgi:hypothetical protein